MPCAEFEELLLGYPELDASARSRADRHALACGECRAFLEALVEIDSGLAARYSGIAAPGTLATAIRAGIAQSRPARRPSPWPEILDFIGSAALLASAGLAAYWFLPPVEFNLAAASALGAAALLASLWFAIRTSRAAERF